MMPFRVFDRENKVTWTVINYHEKSDKYLAAREDDSDQDGEIELLDSKVIVGMKMVDFLDEPN